MSKTQPLKPLNILFHTHRYPPSYMAGGELMVHRVLRYLKETCGHNIKVITMNGQSAVFEGIEVHHYNDTRNLNPRHEEAIAYEWADICLAHLSSFRPASMMRRKTGVPLIAVVHNPPQIEREGMRNTNTDLVLFNAEWCKRDAHWSGPSYVCTPPMNFSEWEPNKKPGDCITLININDNKGAHTLQELARAMPDRKFLAVLGSYGPQLTHLFKMLKNVEVHQHTTDIRAIYKRSRIVVMPSDLETWGMVASEAMASAVPVILSPTDGLRENAGDAALYADRDDTKAWIKHIEALDDDKFYAAQQKRGRERFEYLCGDHYLKGLDAILREVLTYNQKTRPVARINYMKGSNMNTLVKLKAARSWQGEEGRVRGGKDFVYVSEKRAEQLINKGLAIFDSRVPANEAPLKKVVAPAETAVMGLTGVRGNGYRSRPFGVTEGATSPSPDDSKPADETTGLTSADVATKTAKATTTPVSKPAAKPAAKKATTPAKPAATAKKK